MNQHRRWEAMGRDELIEELSSLSVSIGEGDEILSELTRSIAGLAGELLRPCTAECPGHFRVKSERLFLQGLQRYKQLTESAGPEATRPPPQPKRRKVFNTRHFIEDVFAMMGRPSPSRGRR